MLMDDRELDQIEWRLRLFTDYGDAGALRPDDLTALLADYHEARQTIFHLICVAHALIHESTPAATGLCQETEEINQQEREGKS